MVCSDSYTWYSLSSRKDRSIESSTGSFDSVFEFCEAGASVASSDVKEEKRAVSPFLFRRSNEVIHDLREDCNAIIWVDAFRGGDTTKRFGLDWECTNAAAVVFGM